MESNLKYKFKRRSKSYLDWLVYTVKSEKYYLAEGCIMNNKKGMFMH
ncbi:hypothetical protein KO493_12770 [Tamlana agarivorans]|uniref:Uncharacterized protein n=1 Tax=Pseudotamlana agarivorans TaxID=481183 RepID=A0ACC5UB88_9FLAO|nr:hypothetical protein [Tamlana agarivorans]MBU2951572.1 hypothetical protein [Tamlana agarivorans]